MGTRTGTRNGVAENRGEVREPERVKGRNRTRIRMGRGQGGGTNQPGWANGMEERRWHGVKVEENHGGLGHTSPST